MASRGIHERVANQAKNAPERTAVCYQDSKLTYAQLDERANRLANYLVSKGATPGSIVGVEMERGLDLIVALLGVLKAGCAYLPLDPNYPAERNGYMFADSGARLLITNGTPKSPKMDGQIDLKTDAAAIDKASAKEPSVSTDASSLAYVIYTSGSTGQPKGVMIPHENVLRLFDRTDEWFHFSGDDAWTFFHSHAFDFSVWEIWGALMNGGRCVVVPESARKSPSELLQLLIDERITILNQIPSTFRPLIEAATTGGKKPLALRSVIFGGEALELTSLKPWFDVYGDDVAMINMYGITETTVHVTYRPISASECNSPGPSPIGRPIPDLQTHILDSDSLEEKAQGEEGEIFVGGAGLAWGYLGRPALTAERFVPDPFSDIEGARLYRSGDLGCMTSADDMNHLGRNDHQIKIRGFRIETGEIAATLEQHPSVREALVVAHDVAADDRRLVAYVVTSGALEPAALALHLEKSLPDYMIPAAFVAIDKMPVTPSGKIDRKALPAPTWGNAAAAAAPAPAGSGPSERMAQLWKSALNVGQVGTNDDFFELGGHSLLAIKLVNKIKAEFGVELSMAQFFDAPTIAELTKIVAPGSPGEEVATTAAPAQDAANPHIEKMSALWQSALSIERVDPNDDFFELGGHSLLAIKLVNKIKAEFGVELSMAQFFDAPTISGLVAIVAPQK